MVPPGKEAHGHIGPEICRDIRYVREHDAVCGVDVARSPSRSLRQLLQQLILALTRLCDRILDGMFNPVTISARPAVSRGGAGNLSALHFENQKAPLGMGDDEISLTVDLAAVMSQAEPRPRVVDGEPCGEVT